MDSQMHKPKSPYRWLLAIPIQLFINVLMGPLGFWVDMRIWEASRRAMIEEQGYAEGHGFPVFSVLIPLLGVIVTIFVIVTAIICTVVSFNRIKRNQHMNYQKPKPMSPYRWLLAIPIQLVINVLLVPLGMCIDISTGPIEGEIVPVFQILIPLMGVVVTVLVTVAAIACTVVSLIRARNNKEIT